MRLSPDTLARPRPQVGTQLELPLPIRRADVCPRCGSVHLTATDYRECLAATSGEQR